MSHTLYLDRVKIYLDAFGGAPEQDGSLNTLLSSLINIRVTEELPPVVTTENGDEMVVHKQAELTNPLFQEIYSVHMDNEKDFFNGLRIWVEMPEGTLDAEVPAGIPSQYRLKDDDITVKLNREFYGTFYEKAGMNDLILVQYSPTGAGGDLLPAYSYNIDGSENIEQAEARWKFYVILIDAFGIANTLTYENGLSKVPDYEV